MNVFIDVKVQENKLKYDKVRLTNATALSAQQDGL